MKPQEEQTHTFFNFEYSDRKPKSIAFHLQYLLLPCVCPFTFFIVKKQKIRGILNEVWIKTAYCTWLQQPSEPPIDAYWAMGRGTLHYWHIWCMSCVSTEIPTSINSSCKGRSYLTALCATVCWQPLEDSADWKSSENIKQKLPIHRHTYVTLQHSVMGSIQNVSPV